MVINSINGKSSDDLIAVGFVDKYSGGDYKGIILKYDGNDWKFLNIPDIKVGFNVIKTTKDGKYLIEATNVDSGFLEKIFVFDGANTLKEIYSDYGNPQLYEMNGEVYITINGKIYKCINDELVLWKEFPGTSYYGTVLGRSENDFFGAGHDGILHYNGTNLQTLYPIQSSQLTIGGALIFEKDVFFNGYDSEKE